MSEHDTILGHLVARMVGHRHEDAATEGLAYLLGRYPLVRKRFVELLRTTQEELPQELHFNTQEPSAAGRPDMCGRDDSWIRVFVEIKFWAALTDHQPVSYLNTLADVPAATQLLFIVPERRLFLWHELLERVKTANIDYHEGLDPHTVDISDRRHRQCLRILSWETVLRTLDAVADERARANLEQLAGLCSTSGGLEWQPLVAGELTERQVPTRLQHYVDVARGVVEKGCPDVFRGTNQPPTWDGIGYKILFAGEGAPAAWLGVNLIPWRKHGRSPLWLHIDKDRVPAARIKALLSGWAGAAGRMLDEDKLSVMVDIQLLTGRGKHVVIDNVIAQLRTIGALLRGGPAPAPAP